MFELIVYYVIPNVVLFGGIFLIAKAAELSAQHYIDNYDEYQKRLVDIKQKLV